ncbi:MAG TPA: TetR/AcrR family transcriptional regulator [Solirubrobacteraceae bacterium]|nr:TetR/AcrR family transcriptional regulator [Solirubrobacteraceae bacterium]
MALNTRSKRASTAASPRREEPDEDSRTRILEAARQVLAERGYDGASMRAIAARAGVSLGLANYHFKSRRQLLGEVVATSREHFLGVLDRQLPQLQGPEGLRRVLELVLGLRELMPGWYSLCAELDAQGLREEPELAQAARGNKRQGQQDVRQYLLHCCEALGVEPPAGLDGVAATLLAALDGLATRSLLDPEFDLLGAYGALERMTLALLAPGQPPATAPWDLDPYPEQLAADAPRWGSRRAAGARR